MLQTPYRRNARHKHKGFEETETEQSFVDTNAQLQHMMRAGEELKLAKKEQYDLREGDIDDGTMDPSRTTGFDMADASENAQAANRRLAQQEMDAILKQKSEDETKRRKRGRKNKESSDDPENEEILEETSKDDLKV